jgi:hypothetical protein
MPSPRAKKAKTAPKRADIEYVAPVLIEPISLSENRNSRIRVQLF